MAFLNETKLKKAGITIREGKLGEWKLFDGRKLVSKHGSFQEALKAGNDLVQAEA